MGYPKGFSKYGGPEGRRAYYREYHRRRRREGIYQDHCPDCAGPKGIKSARCQSCADAHRIGKSHPRRASKPRPVSDQMCAYCRSEMRQLWWHGRDFMRCPSCGLETTAIELERIAFEGRLKDAA